MKKWIALAVLLLMPTLVFAAVYSTPEYASDPTVDPARTNFKSIGVLGSVETGNPGYIALAIQSGPTEARTTPVLNYLWVDDEGDLCIASDTTVTVDSEFPDGDWTGFTCTKVGGQS